MLYKTAALAVTAAAVAAGNVHPRDVYEKLFIDWMKEHKMEFKSGAEFVQRLQIFADNHDLIEAHNEMKMSYTLGHNKFSHMTLQEFHDYLHLGGTRPGNLRRSASGPEHKAPEDVSSLPTTVDWVSAGAVTEVKNQGSCGSCWSFSATGALEGAYFLKTGTLNSYSEQELVSCDNVDHGCNGGWMDDAFTWVKNNGGLCTEQDYPYTSGNGKTAACDKSSCTNVAGVAPTSFTDVTPGSVDALMSAVAQQPVSIAIQANQPAFQFYKSGVLTGRCGQRLDHGVLAVGYGTYTDGTDYWKVKNSWGPEWGMDGYILIERSDADLCGVLDAASYPNL